ncbi:hypothetical protein NLG97_g2643 [Lecanicillium saksenae]|uniref:Uncharacterized protein n=1 Tax=Lecanicillium saksenae TaxID=468837 RepID=A0ACC1R261_9HYPO|nr:hypothetical protein NLG97_g2643 [Lecanicillium saksenae]
MGQTALDSCELYAIAWIAALAVERASAEAMLDEQHDTPADFQQHVRDFNRYTWGRIGAHNIVIAALPSGIYGTTAAAVTASQLIASLPHIKIGLLVGIAGAIPQFSVAEDASGENVERINEDVDIRLGDVVVGRPDGACGGVVQYDLGKAKQGQIWERKGALSSPPSVLLTAVAALEAAHKRGEFKMPKILAEMWEANPYMATAHTPSNPSFKHQGFENDRLFKSTYPHSQGRTDCQLCEPSQQAVRPTRETLAPRIHYGLIASGNTLIKDALTRIKLAESTAQKCLCYEMEAAGIVSHFPCLVIRGICDYADGHKNDLWQPYASATAAAYAKELLCHLPPRQLQVTIPVREASLFCKSLAHLQAEIDQLSDRSLLSQLPISAAARHDSYAEGSNSLCLSGTRVQVLRDIFNWIDGDGARIFWLNGMAGTGKSTISRTLARTLEMRDQLGGSFFFKRDEEDCNTMRKLPATVAADLARYPAAKARILEALAADSSMPAKSAQIQLQRLVLEPLAAIRQTHWIIIVIDAADECNEKELSTLFNLISDFINADLPKVKLFLTSRPEVPIHQGFGSLEKCHDGIILQNVETAFVEHDIFVFLEHELGRIRDRYNASAFAALEQDWPATSILQRLVKMANKLFIFAAIVCRLIGQDVGGGPDAELRYILSYEKKGTAYADAFAPTYLPVLNRHLADSMPKAQRAASIHQMTLILGTMAVARDPLSVPALARLVDLDMAVVGHRLNSLASVLEILHADASGDKEATRVRFFHQSFRDFLVSPETGEISPIWLNQQEANQTMSSNCLRALMGPVNGLRFNVCGMKVPGTPRSTIPKETINKHLKSEVQYACIQTTYHMKEAKSQISDHDAVHQFLLHHFLHWLEALSFLGQTFQLTEQIYLLQELMDSHNCAKIKLFLDDAIRFIPGIVHILDATPLQIYYSALIFSPTGSVIRSVFDQRYLSWITKKPIVDSDWSIEFQHVEFDGHPVERLFSASDENVIAAIAREVVIILSIRGECRLTIPGRFSTVAFSPNAELIAAADGVESVQIWNIRDKCCIKTVQTSNWGLIEYPMSFIGNGDYLVTISKDRAEIWSTRIAQPVKTIYYASNAYRTVISPKIPAMAVFFPDYIIVWNLHSCQQVRRHKYSTELGNGALLKPILLPSLDIWTLVYSEEWLRVVSPISNEVLLSIHGRHPHFWELTEDHLAIIRSGEYHVWNYKLGELILSGSAPRSVNAAAYLPKLSLLVVSGERLSAAHESIFFWKLRKDTQMQSRSKEPETEMISHRKMMLQQRREVYASPLPSDGVLIAQDSTLLAREYKDHLSCWVADGSRDTESNIQAAGTCHTAFSPNNQFVATADGFEKGTVSVWRIQPKRPAVRVFMLPFQFKSRRCLLEIFFSPDSKILGLMVGFSNAGSSHQSEPHLIQLFSIATNLKLDEFFAPDRFNKTGCRACLSPDNSLVAIADGVVANVMRIESKRQVAQVFTTGETREDPAESLGNPNQSPNQPVAAEEGCVGNSNSRTSFKTTLTMTYTSIGWVTHWWHIRPTVTARRPIMDGVLSVLVSGLFKRADLLKELKNAPTEILELTEDIEILSGVLVQFEDALESAGPRIAETNKQQNENVVSMAAKDDNSLPQKLLAWLRWLSVKSFVAAAGHAIQKLSSTASLFLNSVVCKNLVAQIAELQRNRAEVQPMLRFKLKVAMQICQREERRVEAASAGEATLEEIGLRPKDIRELQRMEDKITEGAMTAVKKAERYTGFDSCQQKQRTSSREQVPANYTSSPSARSPSPRLRPARRTRQSTGPSAELFPQATHQSKRHRDTQAPQRRRRSRLDHTSRERGPLQSASEIEPPGKSRSRLSSANLASTFPAIGSHDIPQPSSARAITGSLPSVEKRQPGIHGPRVRDNGTALIVEESEWPTELLGLSECGRAPSERSGACLEDDSGEDLSIATGPRDGERSSKVSQETGNRRDHIVTDKRTRKKRFGEEYKPSGLFTESDLEERRRRDRGGRSSNTSHAR